MSTAPGPEETATPRTAPAPAPFAPSAPAATSAPFATSASEAPAPPALRGASASCTASPCGPHLWENDADVVADRYRPVVQAQLTPAG